MQKINELTRLSVSTNKAQKRPFLSFVDSAKFLDFFGNRIAFTRDAEKIHLFYLKTLFLLPLKE